MSLHNVAPAVFWLCYLALVVIAAAWIFRSALR